MWLCIGAGMLTLLLAAISEENKGKCADYIITIKGVKNNFFIDKKDVEDMLLKATNGKIKGAAVNSFDLHSLEQMLEHNTWIDEAELYFDNKDVMHVTVTEKEPVARIFATNGNSFYIDSMGRSIPLSDKLSARVPVFTGFPGKKKLSQADSVLLDEVRMTANYIVNDPFWLAQVAQIDITPQGTFEMTPVVGDHRVKLGVGEHIDKKFKRLKIFYEQVLSRTGLDYYKLIDVQYKGQVVVSRYPGNAKVDSIQFKRNVEKLLKQSIEAERDTVIRSLPQFVELEADSTMAIDPFLRDQQITNPSSISNPNTMKPVPKPATQKTTPNPVKENKAKPAEPRKQPKAVMPKREEKVVSDYDYN